MAVEVFMPKMSDHMESGEIIEWLISEGQQVEEGQPIVEVMTDKVAAEIEAPASGLLRGIRRGVEKGAEVPVGETIAYIAAGDEQVPKLPPLIGIAEQTVRAEPGVAKAAEVEATPVAVKTAEKYGIDIKEVRGSGPGGKIQKQDVMALKKMREVQSEPLGVVKASPAARRRARELGVDLSLLHGTGPEGMVRERDVQLFYERGVAPVGAAESGELIELNPIQRVTGERMVLSATTAPQFSLSVHAEVDRLLCIRDIMMDRVETATGRRLSITTLLIKITAEALRQYPRANASYEGGRIRLFRDINIGVAMGTDDGLIVPVVREADRKSITQINAKMKDFEEKALRMKFSGRDLEGGHFTITNLGMYGIERFNAIVNPPQSSILAVGRIINTPVGTDDGSIVLKKLMNLTLSIDHRCMDGIQGARFLTLIQGLIEKPEIFVNGGEHET